MGILVFYDHCDMIRASLKIKCRAACSTSLLSNVPTMPVMIKIELTLTEQTDDGYDGDDDDDDDDDAAAADDVHDTITYRATGGLIKINRHHDLFQLGADAQLDLFGLTEKDTVNVQFKARSLTVIRRHSLKALLNWTNC